MIRSICLLLLLLFPPLLLAQAPDDRFAAAREIVASAQGIVTPDGVQESFVVTLGGARQAVSVRGAHRSNPLLVFVHGGPGSVEMPMAWTFQRPWEDYFTVVQWDQRGAGKSYPLNDPEALAPTMTLERYRDDAIELIELLARKYGQRKVILMGHSWGSAVGLAVAARRPDLLHVYVGVGQAIDWRDNERVGLAWALEQARVHQNAQAVRELEALKPYPDSGPFTIEKADAWRKWAIGWGSLAAYRSNADFYFNATKISPEYTQQDRKAWDDGSGFSVATLWPKLADISFKDLRKMQVPVVLFLGRHDYTVPAPIAADWFERLEAPQKKLVWFEHSAHLPMIEEPGRTFVELVEHVRPFAVPMLR
ncbi:MAG TPA: alpha/beta hydrolase [Steroidobacteraceae bacterium]|nr:alpha/beta hydrolase [Steroidobacteraceae bacterium]